MSCLVNNFIKKIIYLFFAFLSFSFLNAQENLEFEKLTSAKGINESIIYSVQQDSIGNIWMASNEGVIKYNSHFAVKYNKYRGFPDSFGSRVNIIFVDSNNNIWAGTDSGIYKYDHIKDVFKEINTPKEEITIVKSIIEDNDGNIWIGDVLGLWIYDVKSSIMKFVETEKGNSKINVQCLWKEKNRIIIGTTKGLYTANIKNKILKKIGVNDHLQIYSIYKINSDYLIGTKKHGLFKITASLKKWEPVNYSLNNSRIHPIKCIIKDTKNHLYIGTDGDGIYYLDPYLNVVEHYQHNQDDSKSLSSNGIYNLLIDKENILWVATYGGGVNFLNKRKLIFKKTQHQLKEKNSLKNNFTRAIEVDSNGDYWFGTKGGLSVLNKKTNQWNHIDAISDIVLALEKDGDYIWAGTFEKGLFKVNINTLKAEQISRYNKDTIKIKKINTIFKDSKSNIWLGGDYSEIIKISKDLKIEIFPLSPLRTITELKDGSILCGGLRGIYKLNIDTRTFDHIYSLEKKGNDFSYFGINSIAQLNDEEVALATNGQGILIYNLTNTSVKELNVQNGLPSDVIQGLIQLNNSDLWASSSNGLAQIKFTNNDTIINVFDKEDGLTTNQFNSGSYNKFNEYTIAFGGVDGITIFNPKRIKNSKITPKIVFEEFSVFNEVLSTDDPRMNGHVNSTKEIKLDHDKNAISIRFSGILHNAPSKVNYSWKMDGYRDYWSKPSKESFVNFTNLSHGEYVFSVKAANKYGNWGDIKNINIIIDRPWWATTLAYFGYFILAMLLIYFIVYLTKFSDSKKRADEQIEFFNNLTHEIRTPLTILLSSLDEISKSKDGTSKNQAKKTIKRLNSLFDQMLNFRKATIKDNEPQNIRKLNLETHVKSLIENFSPMLEKQSIRRVFVNDWKNDVFYFNKEILNKIFFNLISNAIKYTPDGGEITIKLSETSKEALRIEVTDTGIGIPEDQQKFILKRFYRARNVINSQKPGTGLGLMLVKKLVEKTNGTISFASKENKGTSFVVTLKNQESRYIHTAVLDEGFQKEFNINDHPKLTELSERKILIVEDNNDLRKLLLKKLGTFFKVYEASNGKEGFEIANDIYPDLILTDLIMPIMDGLEMSKKILGDINLNHIPVFMMTALNSPDLKLKGLKTGAAEYIEKPIDINLLLAKITNSLSWQNKLRNKFVADVDKDKVIHYKNEKDKIFINKLELILKNHVSESTFSVYDLCQEIGMSRTPLYVKLKSLANLSPQEFIIHSRLKHAKKMLIEGEFNITEIAYQTGFSNQKYFSTSFKKHYGKNPTSFLKERNPK